MEKIDATIALTAYMRDVNRNIEEIIRILRGIGISLDTLVEAMNRINSTLAEIRDDQHRWD